MSRATPLPQTVAPTGVPVGIGWRHPHYAALLEQQPALDFIEVHSENFVFQYVKVIPFWCSAKSSVIFLIISIRFLHIVV